MSSHDEHPWADESIVDIDRHERLLQESLEKPSPARVYDYYLGGGVNTEEDRAFAKQQIRMFPDLPLVARANRGFLGRAVRYLMQAGVRQFIDLGSGVPTQGNVHEIADREAPGEARVVYVDCDPVAHAHATILLEERGDPKRHRAVAADLLDADQLWHRVLDSGIIDTVQPVAMLIVAVLHFIPPDEHPERALGFYRRHLAPGSFLVLSHGTDEGMPAQEQARIERVRRAYTEHASRPGCFRSTEEFAALFGDWPLITPGVVWAPNWPEPTDTELSPARTRILAGVAQRPIRQDVTLLLRHRRGTCDEYYG